MGKGAAAAAKGGEDASRDGEVRRPSRRAGMGTGAERGGRVPAGTTEGDGRGRKRSRSTAAGQDLRRRPRIGE